MFNKSKSLASFKKYINRNRAKGQGLKFGTNVGIKSSLSSATKRGQLKNLRDNLPAITKELEKNASRIRKGKHFSDRELKKIYKNISKNDKNLTKEDKKEIKLLLKMVGKKGGFSDGDEKKHKKNIIRKAENDSVSNISRRPGMVNQGGRYRVSTQAMERSEVPGVQTAVKKTGRYQVSSLDDSLKFIDDEGGNQGFALSSGKTKTSALSGDSKKSVVAGASNQSVAKSAGRISTGPINNNASSINQRPK